MVAISFPASPSNNDTFTSNGKTWQWNGTFWSLVVSGASVADGSVSTAKIADSAITAAKIADGTVVAAEIASDAITTAKILDANVTTAKLASDSVTTAKITDANITAAKLASSAVTEAKIASDAVTTAKILDANVTTAKVAANAITQAKLASNLSAVTVTTTANRDTDIPSPFTGQLAILTDTRKIQLYDGTSWVNVSLAPPETPTSLSATALSTTSVSIAFTAGGANGSPITNYKYALSTNGGSTYGSFVALDPVDITSPITISGLTAATTYYIKLKAVNDMGDSVASAAVSIGTLATPDAPTSLSATPSGATSVSVAFTPGAQGGSAISNYQYALSTNGGSTYGSFTALDPADATSPITISGLTAATTYYVKLKAVNTDGAGTESSAVSFTTLDTFSVDYLIVGGGGGGSGIGGGGGGGGVLSSTSQGGGASGVTGTAISVLSSTNYSAVVGAGGAGKPYGSGEFFVAGSSTFSSFTARGGSSGVGQIATSDSTQYASGGGGNGGFGSAGLTADPLYGYSGSSGGGSQSGYWGGGGGGAGAAGSAGSTGYGGTGGVGRLNSITGSSIYYAPGGGGYGGSSGAAGGNTGGGGGASGSYGITGSGSNGSANTGGGGGGGGTTGNGGYSTGGSGVIVLRYPNTKTITVGAGLTASHTDTDAGGGNRYTRLTAGSGNVSWT